MSKSLNKSQIKLNKIYGKRLVATAWIIEIIAASLGIFIGFYGAYFAYDFYQINDSKISSLAIADIYIGFAVFIIIAAVELTKIPLVLGFYRTKIFVWKMLFLLTLIFLVFVTFETMFNGLERGFSNTEAVIQNMRTEYRTAKKNLNNINIEIDEINSQTVEDIEEDYFLKFVSLRSERETETKNLANQRDFKINQIYEQIRGLESSYGIISSSTGLQESVNRIEEDIKNIKFEAQQQIENINKTAFNRIENIEIELQNLKEDEKKELERAIFSRRTRDIFNQRRAPLIAEKKEISNYIFQAIKEIEIRKNQNLKIKEDELKKARNDLLLSQDNFSGNLDDNISSLNERIGRLFERHALRENELINSFNLKESSLESMKSQSLIRQKKRESKLPKLEQQREDTRKEIVALEKNINREARGNNIYRITARLYNRESVADLKVEELKVVTTVWFGSIALIAALIGSILALAGYILQDSNSYNQSQKSNRNIVKATIKTLRAMIIDMRKRFRSPVIKYKKIEVPIEIQKIKEVPGPQKIIYKEVPKEIIKNEIVYIPIYSSENGDSTPENLKNDENKKR